MNNPPRSSAEPLLPLTPTRIHFRLRALAVVVLVCIMTWLLRHFHVDDSLIYARYLRNAIAGHGLVFNLGEPVNALTSVVDTWLNLAAATLLRGHIILVHDVTSTLFLIAALLLAERTAPLSGLFIAACPLLYACKGMESSLFLLTLMLSVHACMAQKIEWLPLLCTLAALTRFEGGALVLVIAWHLVKQRRFPSPRAYAAPALLIALYFWFNLHFYHALLPQSAAAKFSQGMSGFWGRWPTAFLLVGPVPVQPLGGSFLYFVLLAISAWFASRAPRLARWNHVVGPFLAILAAFYILFNIPSYYWYYAPFVYFLIITISLGLPDTRPVRAAAAIVLLAMCYSTAMFLHALDKAPQPYTAIGSWIDQNTPPNATIASVETGYIGWYSRRQLIDIVGLTTPRNAAYTAHRDFASWFQARPDYIIVHPSNPFPWERAALASPDYELLPIHAEDAYLLKRRTHPHQ